MTTYNFQEVSITAKKSGKCPKCGKSYTRTKKFWHTINPWNRNADGFIKSWDEVYEDVKKDRDAWLKEPIEPHNCKEKTPPEPSNELTISEMEEMVNDYNDKMDKIIKLECEIDNLREDMKKWAEQYIGKTFINAEYKNHKYSPRETKLSDIYGWSEELHFSILGRNKIDGHFTYDYNNLLYSIEDILEHQVRYMFDVLGLKQGYWVESFKQLYYKNNKTDSEIKCLKLLELYFKLNKSVCNKGYYEQEQECLKLLEDLK